MVGGPASGSEVASGSSAAEFSQNWRGRAAVATLVSLAVLALGAVAARTSSGGEAWGRYEDIARTSWMPCNASVAQPEGTLRAGWAEWEADRSCSLKPGCRLY